MALMGPHFRQEIAQETMDLWWRALADLPDEAYAACVRAMREEEHFPLPGTLRRFVAEGEIARMESSTPYRLRALPAPDTYAVWAAQCRAQAERRTPPDGKGD
jgi:hypothetical protein